MSSKIRLMIILLFFLCVMFTFNSITALAAETDINDSSVETNFDNPSSSEPIENPVVTISNVFKSSLSIGSFVISILLPSLILLLGGKELPKKHVPLYSLVFFLIVSIYRLLVIYLDASETIGTVYLTVLFVVGSIIWVNIYNKYIVKQENSDTEDQDIPVDSNPRVKAKQYIKRYIKSGHAAIESIQLYSYTETPSNGKTEYRLEYIDGVRKRGVEINALLGLNLELDEETLKGVRTVIKLYNDYIKEKDFAVLETRRELLNTTITEYSSQIKQKLSSIVQTEAVSINDCSLARVLLVYCSILASLHKETTFVGFGENSLGLSADIEKSLFTVKRTGTLGAILLQNYPYGFYYNRIGNKAGRTYCSFICKSDSVNYLVLTAFRMPKGTIVPDIGVSQALTNIKEKLTKILGSAAEKEGVTT